MNRITLIICALILLVGILTLFYLNIIPLSLFINLPKSQPITKTAFGGDFRDMNGYAKVLGNGNSALVIGKLVDIKKKSDVVISIVDIGKIKPIQIVVNDILIDHFDLEHQKTPDLFPVSASTQSTNLSFKNTYDELVKYKNQEIKIFLPLEQVGTINIVDNVKKAYVTKLNSYIDCNQKFISNLNMTTQSPQDCDLLSMQVYVFK